MLIHKLSIAVFVALMTAASPPAAPAVLTEPGAAQFDDCASCVSDYSPAYNAWAVAFGEDCDYATGDGCSRCAEGFGECAYEFDAFDYDACGDMCRLIDEGRLSELEQAV